MTTSARRRVLVWDKEDGHGVELVAVDLGADRLEATGVAIGWDPVAYDLHFTLETGAGWITRRLRLATRGDGWSRSLDLRRSAAGTWTIESSEDGRLGLGPPGGDPNPLGGALDCDLGLSPLTNTMPVLRAELLRREGSVDYVMAWVAVPSLTVVASRQRYTTLPGTTMDGLRRIEYRSLDGDFVSVLAFDEDGLVVDYPQLAKRVP